MLLQTPNQVPHTSPVGIEATGHRYRYVMQSVYLGVPIAECTDIVLGVTRRIRGPWACCNQIEGNLYDMEDVLFTPQRSMLKTEVMENLFHGCEALTSGQELPTAHHNLLLRTYDFLRRQRTTISCRTPMPSKRHNVRVLRRSSINNASSVRGP